MLMFLIRSGCCILLSSYCVMLYVVLMLVIYGSRMMNLFLLSCVMVGV